MNFIEKPFSEREIRQLSDAELRIYLEHRGFAVYDWETYDELLYAALEDYKDG